VTDNVNCLVTVIIIAKDYNNIAAVQFKIKHLYFFYLFKQFAVRHWLYLYGRRPML